jgi:nitroreductase
MTEPWRFFVLQDESTIRSRVADLAYSLALERSNNEARAQAARQKVLDPPIVIYIYCIPGPNEEVTRENYGAVCCAIQNICLAGVAEGVAVAWETGGPTRHPRLKETLGAEEGWIMVGMLSIGFPAETTQSRRTPVSSFISRFE